MARDLRQELADAVRGGDVAALAAVAYQLLGRVEQDDERRARQANKKRNQRRPLVSRLSRDVPGHPETSPSVPTSVPSPSKSITTPPPARANGIKPLSASDVEAIDSCTGELARIMGERWVSVDRFLQRRPVNTWPGWTREMLKLIGPGSQFQPEDLAQLCDDDATLEKPLGSAFVLRRFLATTRRERMGGTERSPPARGGGVAARTFANGIAALKDL